MGTDENICNFHSSKTYTLSRKEGIIKIENADYTEN